MKPCLINFPDDQNHFVQNPLVHAMEDFFDIEIYDKNKIYNRNNSVFVCNKYQLDLFYDDLIALVDQGYKIVLDNLAESVPHPGLSQNWYQPNVLHAICVYNPDRQNALYKDINFFASPGFFWYRDSQSFIGTVGHNKNLPRTFSPTKKFILQMRRQQNFRDQVWMKFQDLLDQSIYSYNAKGYFMPNDADPNAMGWDRYCNPMWYNDTYVTVAVETEITPTPGRVFITEKIWKPIQVRHPFLCLANPGSLQLLKSYGFETFDNLWDETYDNITQWDSRLEMVYEIVKNLEVKNYDTLTLEKFEHNHNLFFDTEKVKQGLIKEIVEPVMKFLEQ